MIVRDAIIDAGGSVIAILLFALFMRQCSPPDTCSDAVRACVVTEGVSCDDVSKHCEDKR